MILPKDDEIPQTVRTRIKRYQIALVVAIVMFVALVMSALVISWDRGDTATNEKDHAVVVASSAKSEASVAVSQGQEAIDQAAQQKAALSIVYDLCKNNKLPPDSQINCPVVSSLASQELPTVTGATQPDVPAVITVTKVEKVSRPATTSVYTATQTSSLPPLTVIVTSSGMRIIITTTPSPALRTVTDRMTLPATTDTVTVVATVSGPARVTRTLEGTTFTLPPDTVTNTQTEIQVVTATATVTETAPPVTATATVTETAPPVTATVTDTATSTVSITPAPVTTTATQTVDNGSTVTDTVTDTATVTDTETQTDTATVTTTVTETCALLLC